MSQGLNYTFIVTAVILFPVNSYITNTKTCVLILISYIHVIIASFSVIIASFGRYLSPDGGQEPVKFIVLNLCPILRIHGVSCVGNG